MEGGRIPFASSCERKNDRSIETEIRWSRRRSRWVFSQIRFVSNRRSLFRATPTIESSPEFRPLTSDSGSISGSGLAAYLLHTHRSPIVNPTTTANQIASGFSFNLTAVEKRRPLP